MKNTKLFKSKTKGELIPSVIAEFHEWPTLYMTKDQYYEDFNGYIGFLKHFCIPVGMLKKLHKVLLNPTDFPTNDWEP